MEYQFRNYDIAILTQPMPVEYRDSRAIISCNDCSAKSQTAYHWLGLKCTVCNSYNTIQHQLLNMPGGATTTVTGREAITSTTGAFNHAEQRSLTAETALRILSEIRRSQEEGSGLTRSRSDSSLTRLQNNGSVQPITTEPLLPTTTSATTTGIIAGDLAYLTLANGITSTADTDDDSDPEGEEDVLEFWGNGARYLRNLTSADEGEDGDDDNDEDDDDDNDSSGDDGGVDTDEEDEDDDANEIVLLGHR